MPPPCISQASREEALEVSSATPERPEISSACSPLVHRGYHKMPTRSVKGPRAHKRQTADHGRQHAMPFTLSANRQKLPLIGGLGCIRLNHPGRRHMWEGTYGPRHVGYSTVCVCVCVYYASPPFFCRRAGPAAYLLPSYIHSARLGPFSRCTFNQSPTPAQLSLNGYTARKKSTCPWVSYSICTTTTYIAPCLYCDRRIAAAQRPDQTR